MFKEIYQEDLSFKFICLLLCILPLAIVTSSAIMNLVVILITLIFIIIIFKNNELQVLNNSPFIFLCFFYIYLLLNLKNSFDIDNSLSRTIGFIRYLLLPFAISYVLTFKNFKYSKLILISWLCIFILVSIDLFYEFIFGQNLMGYSNQFPGRLSSFLNDELKIGGYYYGFIILSLATIFYFFSKKIGIFFTIIFLSISILIGERSNFIKIFLSLIIFFLFMDIFSKKIKLLTLTISLVTILFLINSNKNLDARFNNQFISYISDNSIYKYYKTSQYGAHYNSAIEIIKDYTFFGIGFKNFFDVCFDDKYTDKSFNIFEPDMRCSTHPHQTHLDILLSVGLFGYLFLISIFIYFLIISIKSYKKNKNLFTLAGICFVLTTFITPLPAGSFFTSYGATIFWLNIGILFSFKKYTAKISNAPY